MSSLPKTMQAVVMTQKETVELKEVPVPKIEEDSDVLVKVLAAALCGSDMHQYRGHPPAHFGFIAGHEMFGEVVETGKSVKKISIGDRVVSPFTINCGECFFCERGHTGRCVKSKLFGSKLLEGAQAEYVRVPMADSTLVKAPSGIKEETLVIMADIFPTGFYATKTAWNLLNEVERKDAVALVLGCGPVGLCAITAASKRFKTVYAVDSVPDRLELAKAHGAVPLNLNEDPLKAVQAKTDGRGPDVVLEIVGSPEALLLAQQIVRVNGVVVSAGVHTRDVTMSGALLYNKNLKLAFGRCPARATFEEALELLRQVSQDPDTKQLFDNFVQKRVPLKEAPEYYKLFNQQKVGKTVFVP